MSDPVPQPESDVPGSPASPGQRPGADEPRELDRLPPPAFPPETGRGRASDDRTGSGGDESTHTPKIPDDALISPEDPIPGEEPAPTSELVGTATPIGESGPPSPAPAGLLDRPTIHELPHLLDQLARRIEDSGEHALRIEPDIGRFEASLRAFLRGFLDAGGE